MDYPDEEWAILTQGKNLHGFDIYKWISLANLPYSHCTAWADRYVYEILKYLKSQPAVSFLC